MTIGTKIKDIRSRKGLAQAELARRAGVDKTQMCKIETQGRDLRVSTLIRILAVLDVPATEIISVGDRDHDDHMGDQGTAQ